MRTTFDPASDDFCRAANTAGNSILDSVGAGVLVVRMDQTIAYANGRAKDWFPGAGELSQMLSDRALPPRWNGWSGLLRSVAHGGTTADVHCKVPVRGRFSPVHLHVRCSPLRGEDGHKSDFCVVLMTELEMPRVVEEELEVSQRMAALGKLTSRVAHELNNPLDGILRYVNLALRSSENAPDHNLKSYLGKSRMGLMRMVRIVSDLLEFSRSSDEGFDEISIEETIRQAVQSTSSPAESAGVAVILDVDCGEMPKITGSRLYQVCCNLIKNAIDAMPEGGEVLVMAKCVKDDLILRVEDSGVGLPDPPERVFEPFYTTKTVGKGTGIGLAICRDFVEGMGGTIEAHEGESGGAVFHVVIPSSGLEGLT